MLRHSHHIALCLAVATLNSFLHAAENNIASAAKMPADSIDLFAGIDSRRFESEIYSEERSRSAGAIRKQPSSRSA